MGQKITQTNMFEFSVEFPRVDDLVFLRIH